MKKFILSFLFLASSLFGADAANDVIITQRNSGNTGNVQRNLAGTANSLMGFDGSSVAKTITAGSGITIVGGVISSTASGTGTVTSVSFTGGLISVGTPTVTPAFTVAGTSGGVVYFSSTSTWASSALLTANGIMIGGGAGAAPSTTTTAAGILTFIGVPSSANLRTAVTDETGTGLLVFATDPIFTLTDVTTNNSSTSQHGWLPKLPGGTTTFLRGDGTFAAPAGSGTITSGTTNRLPKYTASTTIGDSLLSDDGTTGIYTGTGGLSAAIFTGTGTTPAAISLPAGTGSIPALPANSAGWAGPSTGGTSWLGKLPATITAGVMTFAAPGTVDGVNESAITITATVGTGSVVLSASPTLTGTIGAASLTLSSLTAGRVTYAGTSGLLSDEAALAYNAATNIMTIGGITLGAGSEVSSIGPLVDPVDGTTPLNNINQTVATGTAYTLTTSFAAVDFGTTDPVLTIANAGTYSIYVDVQTSLASATTTNQSVSYKLRRTNNTAADLTGATFGDPLPVATVGSPLGPSTHIGPIKYTTTNTNDSITVQGAISGALGAGTATTSACTITAIRAY